MPWESSSKKQNYSSALQHSLKSFRKLKILTPALCNEEVPNTRLKIASFAEGGKQLPYITEPSLCAVGSEGWAGRWKIQVSLIFVSVFLPLIWLGTFTSNIWSLGQELLYTKVTFTPRPGSTGFRQSWLADKFETNPLPRYSKKLKSSWNMQLLSCL